MRRWHKESVHGAGSRVPLDRNARARWITTATLLRRQGRITPAELRTAEKLATAIGTTGQLNPKHSTIAAWAIYSVSTIKRALAKLRTLGLIAWERRIVRTKNGVRQTSNAYVLTNEKAENRQHRPDAHCERQIPSRYLNEAGKDAREQPEASPREQSEANRQLERVRARRLAEIFAPR
jgi:hypothetical protein